MTARKISKQFWEYQSVFLRRDIEYNGLIFPFGTEGTIVQTHSDGIGFEVEFDEPSFTVITLSSDDFLN